MLNNRFKQGFKLKRQLQQGLSQNNIFPNLRIWHYHPIRLQFNIHSAVTGIVLHDDKFGNND